MDQGIALHATVENVSTTRKAKGGKSYKLRFSYPRAFLKYIDEVIDASVDLFWNEELIASSATVKSATQRPRKNDDPLYLVTFDCDGADTGIANMADKTDTAGDLRVVVTQMSMNLP